MIAPRNGPALSVIMPLSSDAAQVDAALEGLSASDLPRSRWELIVVATGQPAALVEAAAERADVVVRLEPRWRYGSAYRYNRGAEVARSPVLVLLDGDVVVRPDTLRRTAEAFADDGLAALVMGIDPAPRSAGLITRYKTIVQDWIYQNCVGESDFFSTRAAAVRASTYFTAGELDEWQRSDASAMALGVRLRALGRRIELRGDIRVSYRGRLEWQDAAPPLPIQEAPPPWLVASGAPVGTATARYRAREQWLSRLAWASVLLLICAAMWHSRSVALAAATIAIAVVLADLPLGAYLTRVGGLALGLGAIPLRLASLLVRGARAVSRGARARLIGEPRPAAGIEALTEVGVAHWPPPPARARHRGTDDAEIGPAAMDDGDDA